MEPPQAPVSTRGALLVRGASPWFAYVLLSADDRRTYVGITTDPQTRLAAHNGETSGGAKATRAGRPWSIAAVYGPYTTRSVAQQVEALIKRRRGRARIGLQIDGLFT